MSSFHGNWKGSNQFDCNNVLEKFESIEKEASEEVF